MNLKPSRFVETFGGFDQADVALVDQVGQTKPLVLVLFGDRHDEAQVGTGHLSNAS
jgi:hypothetical protein